MNNSNKLRQTGKASTVRIIGGRWSSRKISFASNSAVRPTPDSIRETLFNWLMPYIGDAACLDLYAGSGALGFEAASRGAASVILVESHRNSVQHLQINKDKLDAETVKIIEQKAEEFLRNFDNRFDIVFLDPPFQQGVIESICQTIKENDVLTQSALIYIETEKTLNPLPIPSDWHIIRQHTQGAVAYYLISTDG